MIIGTGDLATALRDRERVLFFASGVSNSQCKNQKEFLRERNLIMKQPKNLCLVYFGTISMYTVTSPYTLHKKQMEFYIKNNFPNYCIIRLGNIDFGKNPNTFLNALREKKLKGEPFEIRDEYKYMISREQLLFITDNLPTTGQHEINIFGTLKKVIDLI